MSSSLRIPLFLFLFAWSCHCQAPTFSSVSPSQFSSSSATTIALRGTSLPITSQISCCFSSTFNESLTASTPATAANSSYVTCSTPVLVFSYEIVKVTLCNLAIASLSIQSLAYPSCMDAKLRSPFSMSTLVALDMDGPGGTPPFAAECDTQTGHTNLMTTVWNWNSTQALSTLWNATYSDNVGTPGVSVSSNATDGASRVAVKYWDRLSSSGVQSIRVYLVNNGSASNLCAPSEKLMSSAYWVVNSTQACLSSAWTNINNALQCLSTRDSGPSKGCAIIPWVHGSCCDICPAYGGGYFSPGTGFHPMIQTQIINAPPACNAMYTLKTSFWQVSVFQLWAASFASHSFSPSVIYLSNSGPTNITIIPPLSSYEAPLNISDLFTLAVMGTSCEDPSLVFSPISQAGNNSFYLSITWQTVGGSGVELGGAYRVCYKYAGHSDVTDMYLNPIIVHGIYDVTSVSPSIFNSGQQTVLTLCGPTLPPSASVFKCCFFSVLLGYTTSTPANVSSNGTVTCYTPLAMYSYENVSLGLCNFQGSSVTIQSIAYPTCMDAKLHSPFNTSSIVALDFDGPGGDPPIAAECDPPTGHTNLMTTVFEWSKTEVLSTGWSDTYIKTLGTPGVSVTSNGTDGAWRIAVKYWPFLSTSGDQTIRVYYQTGGPVGTNSTIMCSPVEKALANSSWAVNTTSACLTGQGWAGQLPLVSQCMSTSDSGTSQSCASSAKGQIPWLWTNCCKICPVYASAYNVVPHPMAYYIAIAPPSNCTTVNTVGSTSIGVASIIQLWSGSFASHAFTPANISLSGGQPFSVNISQGPKEAPVSVGDSFALTLFGMDCSPSLAFTNVSCYSSGGYYLNVLRQSVVGWNWNSATSSGPYKVCYRYSGSTEIVDMYLSPLTLTGIYDVTSVSPSIFNSGQQTMLTLQGPVLPLSTSVLECCFTSTLFGYNTSSPANVSTNGTVTCYSPVAVYSNENVSVGLCHVQGSTVTIQSLAYPTCMDAKVRSPFNTSSIVALDFDGPGGDPPIAAECEPSTGRTNLMTTVLEWSKTQVLSTGWSDTYSKTLGTPGVAVASNGTDGAWRIAAKYWPFLSTSGDQAIRLYYQTGGPVGTNSTIMCTPVEKALANSSWAVNTTSACLTGQGWAGFSQCMSTLDSGLSQACASRTYGAIPWVYKLCCSVCPVYGGSYNAVPRPMIAYGVIRPPSNCTTVNTATNPNVGVALVFQLWSGAFASHTFTPASVNLLSGGQPFSVNISQGTKEAPVSVEDSFALTLFGMDCSSSLLTFTNVSRYSGGGYYLNVTSQAVFGWSWNSATSSGPYKVCYRYSGNSQIVDMYLSPLTITGIYDVTSVSPSIFNSGQQTVLTLAGPVLPLSTSVLECCFTSSLFHYNASTPANVSADGVVTCYSPVAVYSYENVSVGLCDVQGSVATTQSFAYPTCMDAKAHSPFNTSSIVALDFDGPGGNPPIAAECDPPTGRTNLMTTVLEWSKTQLLSTGWSDTYNKTVGTPGVSVTSNGTDGAWRMAVKYWPFLSTSGDHVVRVYYQTGGTVGSNSAIMCSPVEKLLVNASWVVNTTSACLTGQGWNGQMYSSNCLSTFDDSSGPGQLCAAKNMGYVPWVWNHCCTVCPVFGNVYNAIPRPQVLYTAIPPPSNCSTVNIAATTVHGVASVLQLWSGSFAIHTFTPVSVTLSSGGQPFPVTVSQGPREAPVSAEDSFALTLFGMDCLPSLAFTNVSHYSGGGYYLGVTSQSVVGWSWNSVTSSGPYKVCYRYSGNSQIVDMYLSPLRITAGPMITSAALSGTFTIVISGTRFSPSPSLSCLMNGTVVTATFVSSINMTCPILSTIQGAGVVQLSVSLDGAYWSNTVSVSYYRPTPTPPTAIPSFTPTRTPMPTPSPTPTPISMCNSTNWTKTSHPPFKSFNLQTMIKLHGLFYPYCSYSCQLTSASGGILKARQVVMRPNFVTCHDWTIERGSFTLEDQWTLGLKSGDMDVTALSEVKFQSCSGIVQKVDIA